MAESYQTFLAKAPFQVWSIDKKPNDSAIVEAREDTDLEALVSQNISYTDFPLQQYEWYCIDGIVLLKSEY